LPIKISSGLALVAQHPAQKKFASHLNGSLVFAIDS